MNELVFLKSKQPVTTSLIIAEGTNNQHESVIRLITENKARFERWGQVQFSDLKSGNKNGVRDLRKTIFHQSTILDGITENRRPHSAHRGKDV